MCQDGEYLCIEIDLLDLPDRVSQGPLIVYNSIFLVAFVIARGFLKFQYMLVAGFVAQYWGEDVAGTMLSVDLRQWRRVDRLR